jgi:hypothetical protein
MKTGTISTSLHVNFVLYVTWSAPDCSSIGMACTRDVRSSPKRATFYRAWVHKLLIQVRQANFLFCIWNAIWKYNRAWVLLKLKRRKSSAGRCFFIFEGCIMLRLLIIIFGSAVKRNSIFWMFLLLFHTHNMFRLLRVIFRWNTY